MIAPLTTPIGHNGGPDIAEPETPTEDGHDFKMRWVRIHIVDFLQGMRGMTFEERGFYWTAVLQMYDRMEPLPDDDRQAAMLLGCDIRTYRRLKLRLVALSKFIVDEKKRLHNERVDHEINRYIAEAQRKREVALRREEEKRERERAQKDRALVASVNDMPLQPNGLPPNFGRTSGGLPGEVREKFPGNPPERSQQFSEKPNEINVCTTTHLLPVDQTSGAQQNTEYKIQNKKELYSNARGLQKVVAQAMTGPPRHDIENLSRRLMDAGGHGLANPAGAAGLLSMATPMMWLDQGCDLERDILPTITARAATRPRGSIRSWDFFTTPISEAKAKRERGLPAVELPQAPPATVPRDERKPFLTIEFAKGRHYVTHGDVARIQAAKATTREVVEGAARAAQAKMLNGPPKSALAVEAVIVAEIDRAQANGRDDAPTMSELYGDWRTSGSARMAK